MSRPWVEFEPSYHIDHPYVAGPQKRAEKAHEGFCVRIVDQLRFAKKTDLDARIGYVWLKSLILRQFLRTIQILRSIGLNVGQNLANLIFQFQFQFGVYYQYCSPKKWALNTTIHFG